METMQVIVAAFAFTAVALAIFGVLRQVSWIGGHSPDPRALILEPRHYLLADDTRLLWVLAWVGLIALAAGLLAWLAAHRLWLPDGVLKWAAPVVIDASAWHRVFHDQVPENASVYVLCELEDGHHVGGELSWYSTETEESADRDIVLAPPLFRIPVSSSETDYGYLDQVQRLVVSARQIRTLHVIYVSESEPAESGN